MHESSQILDPLFRWIHIFVGILWIGMLYFFNFVNGPLASILDAETKKKVIPELMPRALFWFRWGAAWTWITGVLLASIVFYHGGVLLEGETPWGIPAIVMVLATYLMVFVYDGFAKCWSKDIKKMAIMGIVVVGVLLILMDFWAQFSYRGYVLQTGAMFGTIMAFNVWFRIWPAQQKIITAVKNGQAPDPNLVGLAGMRSRHNTYLSLPLLWTMINGHSSYFSGGNLGIPSCLGWSTVLIIMLLGWHIVWHCYRKAAKVQGF
jgi:uncharacterized membrane protein